MNKSEITERAVRESIEVVNRCNNHRRKPCQVCEYALTKIVERAIAESQAPQHHVCCNGDRSKPPGTKGTSCSCAELGDGEPSPPPRCTHDPNTCKVGFCDWPKCNSGAAQEVSPSANFISEIRPSEAYAAAVSKNLALMEKKFDNLMADSNTIIKQRESRILELEKEIAALRKVG